MKILFALLHAGLIASNFGLTSALEKPQSQGRLRTQPTELTATSTGGYSHSELALDTSSRLEDSAVLDGAMERSDFNHRMLSFNQRGDDFLGRGVLTTTLSADGTVLAVGDKSLAKGLVTVYKWIDGSGWTQRGSNLEGKERYDSFGCAISLSSDGSVLAIGAAYNDANGRNSGHVRVYEWNGSSWTQRGSDIGGEKAYDKSGDSVSLSLDGSVLAIGATGAGDGKGRFSGLVKVYQWNGSVYTQRGSDIEGEVRQDQSGSAISLSSDGSVLAIGARYNEGNGRMSGHVRVYEWNGSSWTQRGSDLDGEKAYDKSGNSVSLSSDGTVLAIGASGNDGNGWSSGHVRVYQWYSDGWSQKGSDIDGEAAGDASGSAVSLSWDGQVLAIGAPWNNGKGYRSGHVRVYIWSWDKRDWTQRGSDLDGKAVGERFGGSVSLSADGTVLAAGGAAVGGVSRVQVFTWDGIAGLEYETLPKTHCQDKTWKTKNAEFGSIEEAKEACKALGSKCLGIYDQGCEHHDLPFQICEHTALQPATRSTSCVYKPVASPTEVEEVTSAPTEEPAPAEAPTNVPIMTSSPTEGPETDTPTASPTSSPTKAATDAPTTSPTKAATDAPTTSPTKAPTSKPTDAPTANPTKAPTFKPTDVPTTSPTKVPTFKPIDAPTANPTKAPTLKPTDATIATKTLSPPAKGSSSGDPHFKTWMGDKYDYHGECDLVLVDHPSFADGLGLRLHIRTTRVKYFSFIEKVAMQIGSDVLEFDNDVENFLINGEKVEAQRKHHKTMLGGYVVRRDPKAISVRLADGTGLHQKTGAAKIDLIQRKNGFPAVIVDGGSTDIFKGSLGLLGEFGTGRTLARDGQTEIAVSKYEATDFALEWQVRDTEPMLFQDSRFPQFPTVCTPPVEMPKGNRLGSSLIEKEAEEACAHWTEDKEDCIFDVIATKDVLVAQEGHIIQID